MYNKLSWIISHKRSYLWFFPISVILHLQKTFFFASNLGGNGVPDEGYHLAVVTAYSKDIFSFGQNNDVSFAVGNIQNIPFLYHYMLGKMLFVYEFFPDIVSNLVFLRISNILISICSLLAVFYISRLVSKNNIKASIITLIFSQIPMFSYISAGVSYDNLLFLFCLLSVLFLTRLIIKNGLNDLLLLSIFVSLGALTKEAFLPFALAIIIFSIFVIIQIRNKLLTELKRKQPITLMLLMVALIITIFATIFFLKNYISFHSLTPSCVNAYSEELCFKKHPLTIREHDLISTKPLRINDFRSQLDYFPIWIDTMQAGLFGVFSHGVNISMMYSLWGFCLLAGVSIGILTKYRLSLKETQIALFSITSAFTYTFLLYELVGYAAHDKYYTLTVAVQGRYLIPALISLIPVGGITMKYFDLKKHKALTVIFIISLLFILYANNKFIYEVFPVNRLL